MPDMKLSTRPATTSQPPQISAAARVRSVRAARRDSHSAAAQAIRAAGISQLICPPHSAPNRRVMPLPPPNPPPPNPPGVPAPDPRPAAPAAPAAPAVPAARAALAKAPPRPPPNPPPPPVSPAQPVVAERELQDVVVGGTADERPARGRGEQADRDPPAPGDQQRAAAGQQLRDAPAEPGRPGPQVGQRQRGQDEERGQHLGQETQPQQRPGRDQPPGAPGLDGPGDGVRSQRHRQRQQRVGVVEAEDQRGDRGQRHDRAGDERGRGPEPAAHGGVQHADRGHALQRLRHQQAPVVHAEHPRGQFHHPQEGRGLVHGDEAGRVQRAEQERLPALGAGLRRGRVELVRPAVAPEAHHVEQGGGREQAQQRRPGPRGIIRPGATQPATAPRLASVWAAVSLRVAQQPGQAAAVRRARGRRRARFR